MFSLYYFWFLLMTQCKISQSKVIHVILSPYLRISSNFSTLDLIFIHPIYAFLYQYHVKWVSRSSCRSILARWFLFPYVWLLFFLKDGSRQLSTSKPEENVVMRGIPFFDISRSALQRIMSKTNVETHKRADDSFLMDEYDKIDAWNSFMRSHFLTSERTNVNERAKKCGKKL